MLKFCVHNQNITYTVDLPTTWEDIEPQKREKLLKYVIKGDRYTLLYELSGLPERVFSQMSLKDTASLISQIDKIDFLPSPKPILPHFTFKSALYHLFNVPTFYIPKADFEDGTAIQFALGLECYKAYAQSKDWRDLHKLVAVIATQKNIDITDKSDLDYLSKAFINMPPQYGAMVLCYFEGVLQLVHDLGVKFGLWEENEDPNTEGGILSPAQLFGWRAIYRNLADHDPIRYDTLCQRPFFEIFQTLVERKMSKDYLLAASKEGENEDTKRD